MRAVLLALCPDLAYIAPHLSQPPRAASRDVLRHIKHSAESEPKQYVNDDTGDHSLHSDKTVKQAVTASDYGAVLKSEQDVQLQQRQEQQQQPKPAVRIGFVSAHFYDQSIGRMLVEVIHNLNRNRFTLSDSFDIEIFVFFVDISLSKVYRFMSYGAKDIAELDELAQGRQDYEELPFAAMRHDLITNYFRQELGNSFMRIPHDIVVSADKH